MAKKESKLTFAWLMLYIVIAFILTTYVVLATWYLQAQGGPCIAS
ncbi:MAG: hypothetical protein WCV71_03820 [Patescibacteria group bacterium]